ncbi:27641_t:CDS:2 [Dentiscutata erythropus]|uniref:27641_t:CDS:1 n=1 Tax=Dentiscutata erythropus TaxID=1348616 RepID=A0A9N9B692_9GLOM|nr:27641_t:CDS:2 [Dentiscutata erythropus]
MYRGKIELGGQDGQNLLNLLTAGDELMLDEFCNYIQNFLIHQKFEWLEDNLVEVLRITGSCSCYKSFIFSLGDGKNLQEVKLSRVRDSATSMYGHTSYGPHFGTADLRMYSPFNNKENCSCQQASYFRTVTEHVRFAAEEYEVFQVVPKQ